MRKSRGNSVFGAPRSRTCSVFTRTVDKCCLSSHYGQEVAGVAQQTLDKRCKAIVFCFTAPPPTFGRAETLWQLGLERRPIGVAQLAFSPGHAWARSLVGRPGRQFFLLCISLRISSVEALSRSAMLVCSNGPVHPVSDALRVGVQAKQPSKGCRDGVARCASQRCTQDVAFYRYLDWMLPPAVRPCSR